MEELKPYQNQFEDLEQKVRKIVNEEMDYRMEILKMEIEEIREFLMKRF